MSIAEETISGFTYLVINEHFKIKYDKEGLTYESIVFVTWGIFCAYRWTYSLLEKKDHLRQKLSLHDTTLCNNEQINKEIFLSESFVVLCIDQCRFGSLSNMPLINYLQQFSVDTAKCLKQVTDI